MLLARTWHGRSHSGCSDWIHENVRQVSLSGSLRWFRCPQALSPVGINDNGVIHPTPTPFGANAAWRTCPLLSARTRRWGHVEGTRRWQTTDPSGEPTNSCRASDEAPALRPEGSPSAPDLRSEIPIDVLKGPAASMGIDQALSRRQQLFRSAEHGCSTKCRVDQVVAIVTMNPTQALVNPATTQV